MPSVAHSAPVDTDDRAIAEALIAVRRGAPRADAHHFQVADDAHAYWVQARVAQAFGWPVPARHWKSGGPARDRKSVV